MEVKLLKVIERHQILMLALRKQISQIKAAEELGLSLSRTKLLMRKLKKAEGDIHCFLYRAPIIQLGTDSPNRSGML